MLVLKCVGPKAYKALKINISTLIRILSKLGASVAGKILE